MSRPRWHDVLIAASIVGILGYGVWAMWGREVRLAGWGEGSSAGDAITPSRT